MVNKIAQKILCSALFFTNPSFIPNAFAVIPVVDLKGLYQSLKSYEQQLKEYEETIEQTVLSKSQLLQAIDTYQQALI